MSEIKEVYKGYIIEVENEGFKIVEEIAPGKFKTRRKSNCDKYTGKRNHNGDKLYTSFPDNAAALERAKNYIDNHIKPWSERLIELGRTK